MTLWLKFKIWLITIRCDVYGGVVSAFVKKPVIAQYDSRTGWSFEWTDTEGIGQIFVPRNAIPDFLFGPAVEKIYRDPQIHQESNEYGDFTYYHVTMYVTRTRVFTKRYYIRNALAVVSAEFKPDNFGAAFADTLRDVALGVKESMLHHDLDNGDELYAAISGGKDITEWVRKRIEIQEILNEIGPRRKPLKNETT